jgi:allophanate hydrolase subunit 2
LRAIVGPRSDWFTSASIERLLSEQFELSQASNRIGLRLQGPVLERAVADELLSEGLVPGAIQVPPDGQPILLLADHPTTGGYPVIAVVHSTALSRAAQLRPGQRVRFRA